MNVRVGYSTWNGHIGVVIGDEWLSPGDALAIARAIEEAAATADRDWLDYARAQNTVGMP
jgi:hypothetical protein